jgi:diguanylate cyclase (GGDEF)-like protein
MNELRQIFDNVNIGLIILDSDLRVKTWNRWMALHSRIPESQIIETPLFDAFPNLNTKRFLRNCKAVLAFGNFIFLSQKLHGHLFPFHPTYAVGEQLEHMQQSCTMGPIRGEGGRIEYLYMIIQDVSELVHYEKKLLEMNMRDGLTGAFNRRYLDRRLEEEIDRSRRYSQKFSLILFDIDFFKTVNDTHGHHCGDLILKSVASKVTELIRKSDCLARYGGEEFCCLLPGTDLQAALVVAEKLRFALEAMDNIYRDANVKITVSLGVSEIRPGCDTPAKLFDMADRALYRAKGTGRNRVVSILDVANDEAVPMNP